MSNYFHRDRFIGHGRTVNQIIESIRMNDPIINKNNILNIINPDTKGDIKTWKLKKMRIIEHQAGTILELLSSIVKILKKANAEILHLDIVEYSPSA